jgi:hypothetical protein
MALLKCRTCGGEYDTRTADGLQYFHTCPPLSVQELKDAIAAGTLLLRPRDQRVLDAAIALDEKRPPLATQRSSVDLALEGFRYERPDHRDENVDLARAAGAVDARGERPKNLSRDALVKRAGLGVDVLIPDDSV